MLSRLTRVVGGLLTNSNPSSGPVTRPRPTSLEDAFATFETSLAAREATLSAARDGFLQEVAGHLCDGDHFDTLVQVFSGRVHETLSISAFVTALGDCDEAFRADLFQALHALRTKKSWLDQIGNRNPNGRWDSQVTPDVTLYRHGEDALFCLCEVGFPVDAAWATDILRFINETSHYQPGHAVAGDYRKMRVLKDLASVFASHEDLPKEAMDEASALADRAFQDHLVGKNPLGPGGKLLPKHRAMMHLAGIVEENFLQKMRRQPAPRVGHPDRNGIYKELLPVLQKVQARVEAMVEEFTCTGGRPPWMESETAYEAIFGQFDDEVSAFGWWDRPPPNGAGPAVLSDKTYGRMAAPGAYDGMYDWVGALEDVLAKDVSRLPFEFASDAIPDIELFTFGGADPEGLFLAHLSTATSSKPNKDWRKATVAHLDRIGRDAVLEAFRTWLGYCVELDDTFFAAPPLGSVPVMAQSLATSRAPGRPTREALLGELDEQTLNRAALSLMKVPWWLSDKERKSQWYEGGSEKHRHRGSMSHVNVCVMSGVLWSLEHWSDTTTVGRIEQAALFCFKTRQSGLRSRKAGNAALWALGQIATIEAVQTLARLRGAVVEDKAVFKQIDKALEATAKKAGVSLDEVEALIANP